MKLTTISKKKICRIIGVSRQSIYWKIKGQKLKSRKIRYKKYSDNEALIQIHEILKIRPTYGYKRVTSMINKKRRSLGLKRYNRKRIERVMDINGLLQVSHHPKRDFEKTGKIITLHSNTRWCSDGFEIHCFNGEKVYVAFSLDCHDRYLIDYVASKKPLLALDIQSLMISSIEKRFDNNKAPQIIQWLSDRGSIYRSLETIECGRYLNLKSCFTRPRTPQSNGMAEAFVGTIKRDYVYISDCEDAKTVLKFLPKWIKDYNEEAPHSGLGMMSPVEYKRTIN